jgi:hypothetical protein
MEERRAMAKKIRKTKKQREEPQVGLAHVGAAIDIVQDLLDDIRAAVTEFQKGEEPNDANPGRPCGKMPALPCDPKPAGKPCEKLNPGMTCRPPKARKTH